jgi:putative inorganic carbon (HCO3(-)) transporter
VDSSHAHSSPVRRPKKAGFLSALNTALFVEKLRNPLGLVLLSICAIVIAVGTAYMGVKFGAIILGVFIGIPAVYGIVAYPKFGMLVLVVISYLLFYLGSLGLPIPLGTLVDSIQALLFLGLMINIKRERNLSMLRGPLSVIILIWIGYNVMQVANPFTEARGAWIYTIRSVAIVMLTYFVFVYNVRTVQYMRLLFKVWLGLCLFAALYAYKQEYIGFSAAEDAYLNSSPLISSLLFISGHWRKFSILSDPVSFAYNMVMPSIFCISLIAGKFASWKKVVMGIMTVLFLHSMLFSGTRGANVLLPAAICLFAVLNYNKKVLAFAIAGAVFLFILINIPTSNPNILRFQTAFSPNADESYKLRKSNQKKIQPYILTHPIGGGLGATGEWGKRFAPGSFLASFPPDSGYIRVAVELGWIGLLIFCIMMFMIMKQGINGYYTIKDPELRTYCLAMTLIVFAYNLGNFPQEALVQFPSNILFSMMVAMITVSIRLDREKQEAAIAQLPKF